MRLLLSLLICACHIIWTFGPASAQDAPVTLCDTYAASPFDPQRKAPGVSVVNPTLAIPACISAAGKFPTSPRLKYQLGRAYYAAKNFRESAASFQESALQGYAPGQTAIADAFQSGEGAPQNYRQAAYWYSKAAQQGYAIAQNSVGAMYLQGQGVDKNPTVALEWFRKSAEQGNPDAEKNLARLAAVMEALNKKQTEEEKRTKPARAEEAAKQRATVPAQNTRPTTTAPSTLLSPTLSAPPSMGEEAAQLKKTIAALKSDEAEKAKISGQPNTAAQVSKQEIEKLTVQNKGLQADIVRLEQNKQILQVERTVAETQIEKIYFVAFAVIAGFFVVLITLGLALVIVSRKKVSAVKASFQPNTPDIKSNNKTVLPAFSAQSQRLSLERDKHQSTALLSFSRFVSATCKLAFFPMLVAALIYGDHLNDGQLLPDDVYCLLRAGKVRTSPGSMSPIASDAPGGNPMEWRVNPPSVSCQHESLWSGWTNYSTKISLLDLMSDMQNEPAPSRSSRQTCSPHRPCGTSQ